MTELHERPEDRTTAAERVPHGGQRREFADGVYVGAYGDSHVHLPPRPVRRSHYEQRMTEIAAWRERQRRFHIRLWKTAGWAVLVLGAVLMVAVTHG